MATIVYRNGQYQNTEVVAQLQSESEARVEKLYLIAAQMERFTYAFGVLAMCAILFVAHAYTGYLGPEAANKIPVACVLIVFCVVAAVLVWRGRTHKLHAYENAGDNRTGYFFQAARENNASRALVILFGRTIEELRQDCMEQCREENFTWFGPTIHVGGGKNYPAQVWQVWCEEKYNFGIHYQYSGPKSGLGRLQITERDGVPFTYHMPLDEAFEIILAEFRDPLIGLRDGHGELSLTTIARELARHELYSLFRRHNLVTALAWFHHGLEWVRNSVHRLEYEMKHEATGIKSTPENANLRNVGDVLLLVQYLRMGLDRISSMPEALPIMPQAEDLARETGALLPKATLLIEKVAV